MAEDAEDDATLQGKVGKKKHYPFGTSTNIPYSAFAHITGKENTAFARQLAFVDGVEAEVVEDVPQRFQKPVPDPKILKQRKANQAAAAAAAEEEDAEEETPFDDIPDADGLGPCKQLPCQAVLKQLLDIQLKNRLERLEIEDEHARLTEDLEQLHEEIAVQEANVEKKQEVGNQLENTLNKLLGKVEKLEQDKEFLTRERNDINSKLMLLETEKQKSNRKLEQAQKALTDAMWRKKKEAQMQNVEDGLSLAPSSIGDNSIVRAKQQKVAEGSTLSKTSYPILARRGVTDYTERTKGVLTIPQFTEEHKNHDSKAFDKYMDAHYDKLKAVSIASRKLQTELGTLSFSSVEYSHAAARGEADIWPRRSSDDSTSIDGTVSVTTRSGGGTTIGGSGTMASLRRSGGSNQSSRGHIRLQPLSRSGSLADTRTSSSSGWGSLSLSHSPSQSQSQSSEWDGLQLDASFYTNSARAAWARSHAIGKLRKLHKPASEEERQEEEESKKAQGADKVAGKKKVAVVNTKRLKPSVLTIRHPGMDIFADSVTMTSLST